MNLNSLIPDASAICVLPPEELAAPLLQVLNWHSDHERRGAGRPFNISLSNFCIGQANLYNDDARGECAYAIAAGFQCLVNLGMLAPNPHSNPAGWYTLTARALKIRTVEDYAHFRSLSLYPRGAIHPTIEQETFSEFLRGDYETAVFKAFKAIEVFLRTACALDAGMVGKDIMVRSFQPDTGILTDPNEVKAEREALMHLFMGSSGRFRNSTGHREVNFSSPAEVIEVLQFASLLMRTAETRAERRRAGG